jgi:hypothetical protein
MYFMRTNQTNQLSNYGAIDSEASDNSHNPISPSNTSYSRASFGSLALSVGDSDAALTIIPTQENLDEVSKEKNSPGSAWICIKRANYVIAMMALLSITSQMTFDAVFSLSFPEINPLCGANASSEDGILYDVPRYAFPFFIITALLLTLIEHLSPDDRYKKFKHVFHKGLIPASANCLKGFGTAGAVVQCMLLAGDEKDIGASLIPLQFGLGSASLAFHFIGQHLDRIKPKNKFLGALLYFTMALDPMGSWLNWASAFNKLADNFSIFFAKNNDEVWEIFNSTNYTKTDNLAWFLGAGLGIAPTAWLISKSYQFSCREKKVSATDVALIDDQNQDPEKKCCSRTTYADRDYKETTHAVTLLPIMFLIYMMGLESTITYIVCDFGGDKYNPDAHPQFSFYGLSTGTFYGLCALFCIGSIRHCIFDCKVNAERSNNDNIELGLGGSDNAAVPPQTRSRSNIFARNGGNVENPQVEPKDPENPAIAGSQAF